MTPLEHLRVREGDVRSLPRRIPVLDMDATWQARADRHEPRARIDWLNVLVWGAVLALCAGVWAAIAWAAWDGLAAMIETARAAPGRAVW